MRERRCFGIPVRNEAAVGVRDHGDNILCQTALAFPDPETRDICRSVYHRIRCRTKACVTWRVPFFRVPLTGPDGQWYDGLRLVGSR